jgi:hypothetical protein
LTRSGAAVIRALSLVLGPIAPPCVTLSARHGDPKQRTSKIVIAEKTKGRFAKTQGLTVADNDDAFPGIVVIMERTLEFAGAIPLVTFQRAVRQGMIGSSKGAHRKT